MKLAIIGSRSITDKDKVYRIIKEYIDSYKYILWISSEYKIDTIISGGAIGVDSIAKEYAKDNNLWYIEYNPNDKDYEHLSHNDKRMKRNSDIAAACDVLLCIHDGCSRGSLFAYDQAVRMGKKAIYIYIK